MKSKRVSLFAAKCPNCGSLKTKVNWMKVDNMRKYQLSIFGLSCCAAVVLAQTLPPTLPTPNKQGYDGGAPRVGPVRRTSQIDGKEYVSILEQPAVSPDWESSTPLPITLSAAEKLARAELAKVVADESGWITTDFQISRFGAGPSWYYSVTLKPALQLSGERAESFTILVDFSGKPGRVWQLGPRQVHK